MIDGKLVRTLEQDLHRLAGLWMSDVRVYAKTPSYQHIPDEALLEEAMEVYSSLALWLDERLLKDDLQRMFEARGENLNAQGRRASEVIAALQLMKRHIWFHVLSEGLLNTAVEIYQVLDLNNRVVLYFDRAVHSILRGYEFEPDHR